MRRNPAPVGRQKGEKADPSLRNLVEVVLTLYVVVEVLPVALSFGQSSHLFWRNSLIAVSSTIQSQLQQFCCVVVDSFMHLIAVMKMHVGFHELSP